jgi:hypothetical protein
VKLKEPVILSDPINLIMIYLRCLVIKTEIPDPSAEASRK